MKVRSERSSRRRSLRSARIGAALLVVALVGAGSVPTLVAFAQMVEDEHVMIADTGLGLDSADSRPDPDGLRTPSGLATLQEQVDSTRIATVVQKPEAVRPAPRQAAPAPAPAPAPASAKPAAPTPAAAPAAAPAPEPAATDVAGWKSARASWYGPGLYGNSMAGGGVLQPDSMVVAHRSLAFGTRVEFSYNGRTCIATVQDRGPFTGGRIFDLGPGTAKTLGFSGVGTVSYRIL